jgi:hypothetical protein
MYLHPKSHVERGKNISIAGDASNPSKFRGG